MVSAPQSPFSLSKLLTPHDILGIARSHIMSVLQTGVKVGELVITDAGGRAVFGSPKKGRETVVMVVTDERLWTRMLTYVPPPRLRLRLQLPAN